MKDIKRLTKLKLWLASRGYDLEEVKDGHIYLTERPSRTKAEVIFGKVDKGIIKWIMGNL